MADGQFFRLSSGGLLTRQHMTGLKTKQQTVRHLTCNTQASPLCCSLSEHRGVSRYTSKCNWIHSNKYSVACSAPISIKLKNAYRILHSHFVYRIYHKSDSICGHPITPFVQNLTYSAQFHNTELHCIVRKYSKRNLYQIPTKSQNKCEQNFMCADE